MMKKHIYHMLLLLGSVQPLVVSASTVHPFIDVLAWRASETSSAWAEIISPAFNPDLTPAVSNSVDHAYLDFHTSPGFKAGLTYVPDDNYLDTTFYWTHFSTNSSRNIPIGNQVIASLFFSGSFFLSDSVSFGAYGNWQLAMNILDLEVSHHFNPTPALTLTPKLGVKGGTINQSMNVDWYDEVYTATERVTNNFTGIGPSFGINANLNLWKNFNLVGDVSTALMYGRWNESDIYDRPAALLGTVAAETIYTSMNKSKLGSLMMDYYLGLQWVHEGQSRVSLNLGYEMQYWAGQLRWLAVQQFPPLGDLTLQGATCGITIDL
jgi:hypothetical protein